jgi:hypothetical protein
MRANKAFPMSLFSIHCTTCRAALKVNDATAIGKILACPRCQSMVQVVPPADWNDPTPIRPAIISMAKPLVAVPPPLPEEALNEWSDPAASMSRAWAIGVSASLAVAVVALALWKSLDSDQQDQPAQDATVAELVTAEQPTQPQAVTAAPEAKSETKSEGPAPTGSPAAEPASPPVETTAVVELKPTVEVAPTAVVETKPAETAPASPAVEPPAPQEPLTTSTSTPKTDTVPPKPGRRAMPTNPPRVVDVSARLGDRLPRVEWKNGKLIDFLGMISDVSTLSITIDPTALLELGIAADTPISVSQANTTVGKALDAALQPLGLGYGIEGSHIIVATRSGSRDAPRRVRYAVSDLTGNDPAALTEFARLIRTLVQPDSWQEAGGNGMIQVAGDALMIEQTGAVHYQVLALCEKLRVARGRPLRSRYDPSRFRLDSAGLGSKANAKTVTMTFLAPTSLERMIDRLQKATGACLLVDWQALETDGISPDSEATLKVKDQPIEAAVAQLVEPLELAWLKIDDRTFQITTVSAALGRQPVEFYRVADVVPARIAAAELLKRIQTEVAPKQWNTTGGDGAAYFDATSGYLLVSQPQPTQTEVRTWLDQLRTAK